MLCIDVWCFCKRYSGIARILSNRGVIGSKLYSLSLKASTPWHHSQGQIFHETSSSHLSAFTLNKALCTLPEKEPTLLGKLLFPCKALLLICLSVRLTGWQANRLTGWQADQSESAVFNRRRVLDDDARETSGKVACQLCSFNYYCLMSLIFQPNTHRTFENMSQSIWIRPRYNSYSPIKQFNSLMCCSY